MADILGLIKKFGLKGEAGEGENDLLQYGKNLKELAVLESLDKEYEAARNEVKETQRKLSEVEETIISIEEDRKEKVQLAEQLYVEGRSFYDQGDFNRAIERWHHVLEVFPQHKRSVAAIQDAKERLNREDKERIERQSVAEKKAQDALEHFELGKKYYREKNYEQAVEEFETAISCGGRNPDVVEFRSLAEQRIKEVEEQIQREKKQKSERESLINEHCRLANNYHRQEKHEEALQEWEKALILDKENKILQENVKRGESFLRDHAKQLEGKARGVEEKLRRIREFQIQGMKYYREQDFEKAIESWEQAISIDPSREDVYLDIRSAQKSLTEQGRIRREKEEKEKERLLTEQERERLHQQEMERLRLENGEKDKERLWKEQQMERQRQEESSRLRRESDEREKERLHLEEERRRKEDNERVQREEEEKKSKLEKMKAHYGRGLRFYKLQEYEKALTEWEIVISLDPQFENVTDLMDQAGRRIEEIQKAKEEERRRAEEGLSRVQNEERRRKEEITAGIQELFMEGMQHAHAENYEKALQKMQQALALKRDDAGIRKEISEIEKKIQGKYKTEEQEKLQREQQKMEDERMQLKIKLLSEQAQMYFEDGDYQRAMEEWRKVLEIEFSNQDARTWIYKAERSIKDAQRKMAAEEASRRERKETISRLNFEAIELFNDGHYEEAIRIWSKVFEMDPTNSDAKQGMVKGKQRIKEIENRERARQIAKKLIQEQESRLGYLKKVIEKGERFYIEGDYKQALLEWEKALEGLKS